MGIVLSPICSDYSADLTLADGDIFCNFFVGTQTSYARDIESDIGTLGRYTSANVEAFELSNWSLSEQQTMNEQWAHVTELPEIPGGYYVSRNLDNAFRAVVLSGNDERESLFYLTSSTNEEIARKRHEMGLND